MSTTRHLRFPAFSLALILLCLAGCDKYAGDKSAIKQAWDQISLACNDGDGRCVVELTTAATLEYYGRLVKLGLEGTGQEIARLPVIWRWEIMNMRHLGTQEALKPLDGRGYVQYAVSQGWWADPDGDSRWIRLGEIKVNGDYARARIIAEGKATGGWLHFIRENSAGEPDPSGFWRYHEVESDSFFNHMLVDYARQRRLSEDNAMMELLYFKTGRMVRRDILDRVRW